MSLQHLDLYAERWELARLAVAILQPVLVVLLCFGFVLASAHLLTMLGTRWGKRRVSLKALAFSLAVHVSLACGIIALWPETESVGAMTFARTEQPQEQRFRIEQLLNEPVPDSPVEEGNTPVWERLPDVRPQEHERTPLDFVPREDAPPPRPAREEMARLEQPELTPLPVPDAPRPDAVDSATAPLSGDPVAVPLPSESVAAQARDEVRVEESTRERSEVAMAAPLDPESIPRPQAGSVDRIAEEFDPQSEITSVDAAEDEAAELQRADIAANIDRREAPVPSSLVAPDAGADVEPSREPAAPSVARSRTTPARTDVESEAIQRYRPDAPPPRTGTTETSPQPAIVAVTPTEVPALERPDLLTPGDATAETPAPYKLRTQEFREEAVRQFGGSKESEEAVESALKWLAENQLPAGNWDADAHGGGTQARPETGDRAGQNADTGVTGLAVLAFVVADHTPGHGRYADNVQRALRWLVMQQRPDGSLAGDAGLTDSAYCHAIASFALAEAYAYSTHDDPAAVPWLRRPVARAIQHTLDTQLRDGGWRYQRGQPDGDMSIFGWQLMALKTAELAGIPIDPGVRNKLIGFLKDRSLGQSGGLAGYRAGERPTPPMTAEALFCKQMLGLSPTNPASLEAVAYLSQALPHRSQLNYYYWYYGTLAMKHHGGEAWDSWNDALRDLLVSEQRKSGALAGSWDPRDIWGVYGGRVYSTAICTLSLQVYYRYLSIHRPEPRFEPAP